MSYLKRTVTAGVVVLTAGFLACRENPADVAPSGDLALEIAVAEGVSLAQADQVRVTLRSAGAADINFTLSRTGTNQFEGTRQSLQPGTYTVTIRGITGGEVDFFGETTADVQAGVDATVNITLTSFVPAIDPIPNTTSVNFTATWPAVIGAESYEVEASSDPTFLTFFAPDAVTDAGATISADFTAPGIGSYYISVRAQRSGIETGRTGLQTAGVVNGEILTGNLLSSTISASGETQVFGVTGAAGQGMSVLAFRTGASIIDLDVTLGPVNGSRVGGNNDLGVLGNSVFEWLAAYESPTPSPAGPPTGAGAVVLLEPTLQEPTPEKLAAEISAAAVTERLRDMAATLTAEPSVVTASAATTGTDQRTIEVFGAGGTTGDYDVFYHTCEATETALGQSVTDTLATTDCFTFNPISGNLTYGKFWVFNAAAGDTLALELTSSVIDAVLFLFDDNGNLIGQNDDASGTDSRLVVIIPTDAQYIVFTGSFEDLGVGEYTLALNRFAPAAAIVAYIDVTPYGTTLSGLGDTVRLIAEPFDSTDTPIGSRTIDWFSLNDKVATVDNSGLVTAQGNGQTTIVAEADGAFGGAVVNVLDGGLTPVNAWTPAVSGVTDALWGVWGTGLDDIFTVGLNGTILHNDGTGWTAQASPTSGVLYSVWGLSSTDIYAVGADGTILSNFDGATWNDETGVTSDTLLSVWGTSWDDVWAVGSNGTIVHFDGGSWNLETSPVAILLLGMWGTSVDDVFAVGAGGTILHYDGAGWTQMASPTAEALRAVWGTAPDNVFAVGALGTILRYDGATWTAMISPTTRFLRAVWGSSGTEVYAVGGGGTIVRYDGTSWAVQTSGTTNNLRGVWGAPERPDPGVFVVGNNGTALLGVRGAGAPSITSVTPDTLVEGQSATITGSGFFSPATGNTVLIDGATATVTSGTATSLVVTVPQTTCLPKRDVNVTASIGALASNTLVKPVKPGSFVSSLAVGEQQIIRNPANFCLQFAASAVGGDSYIIGVSATAEVDAVQAFTLNGTTGAAAGPAFVASAAPALRTITTSFGPQLTQLQQELQRTEQSQAIAEARIRQWEHDNFRPELAASVMTAPAQAAAAVPVVGDIINFNVPNIDGLNLCTDFTTITTKVKVVGTNGIFVTDVTNPLTDTLTTTELAAFSSTFDTNTYPVLSNYFGTPGDIDANSAVIIVLTKQVNSFAVGAAGFVVSTDLMDPASCASSNNGEIFYGYVPDPLMAAGPIAHTHAAVVKNMPPLIAHEVTHNIQQGIRSQAGGVFMSSWEAEGQADLAKEVVGHSVLGKLTGQDYDSSVVNAVGTGDVWYQGRFTRLAQYFGWDLAAGQVLNAPEDCSLFGFTGGTVPCTSAYYYGASWSFLRFINDRFGPTYAGGEQALQRDLIAGDISLNGRTNVETLLGLNFADLFAEWAAMLYVDGRIVTGPEIAMPSWNLFNIYQSYSAALSLTPTAQTFLNFADARSVRGGSTYYTLLSSAGARLELSIGLDDGAGAPLPATLNPRYWIVRVQ